MKEWIPIPGTSKDTILSVAMEEFSLKGYKAANITHIAEKAEMTTGAIYHHFGSKANLYHIIRNEMEQRILDRMEGASSLFDQPEQQYEAALISGLDFALKLNLCKLLSDELPNSKQNKIESFFREINQDRIAGLEYVVYSAWRSILIGISEGMLSHEQGKNLIRWMFKKEVHR